MPHMTKTTALQADLIRSGAYAVLGTPSRVVNGRIYLQLEDGGRLYVGPGVFHNAETGAVLFIFEAHDCGHYCLAENQSAEEAAILIGEFLTYHGVSESALRAKSLALPAGWTADP